jgi:exodeoxyribonuclease III
MAFRKKNEKILSFKPDILIISECENEVKLEFDKLTAKPNDFFWYGESENKGIGIFSYSDYKFELIEQFNPRFRYIIPLKAKSDKDEFILYAIWAMDNKENYYERYIAQIWLAINYYNDLLNKPSVLIGDFNSNKIWDKKKRLSNHTNVVNFLQQRKINSLYHNQFTENQGEESKPTFYLHRNINKPYHIDYCFASENILLKGYNFSIGNFEDWISLSDHVPIFIELNS